MFLSRARSSNGAEGTQGGNTRLKVIISLPAAPEDAASRLKLSAFRNKSQPSAETILMNVWKQVDTFHFTNSSLLSVVKCSHRGIAGVKLKRF